MESNGALSGSWTGLLGSAISGGFGFLAAREQAEASVGIAQANAAGNAALANAQFNTATASAIFSAQGTQKILIAGMVVAAVVVLFRIRPTANQG
jgi:hypothetical protein